MGWVRDASKCSAQSDGFNVVAREGYLVGGGLDPVALACKPQNFLGGVTGTEPLPRIGETHPSEPRARLDSYAVDTDGGASFIIGQYSSDGRYSVPQLGPPNAGYRWRATTQECVFPLPYSARTTDVHWKPVADGATGPPEPLLRYRWVYLKENFTVKAQRIGYQMRIRDDRIQQALETLYQLQGKAMPINGRVWVFEGGDVDEAGGATDYRLQLNFMREQDIVLPSSVYQPREWWPKVQSTYGTQPTNPDDPNFSSSHVAKPAYHKTVFVPPENGDVSTHPEFKAIPMYEYAENGFEALMRLAP